jgi:methylated-DNA-protein-cysteine methyltransferase-like protein
MPVSAVAMADDRLYNRIYALIRQVPRGYVTTYREISHLTGCTARTVGFALAALPDGHDVPWQRVINSQGRVSARAGGDGSLVQRLLLEKEGIRFDDRQQVDLQRYGWRFQDVFRLIDSQGRNVQGT